MGTLTAGSDEHFVRTHTHGPRIAFWMASNCFNGIANCRKKQLGETASAVLIPLRYRFGLRLRFGKDSEFHLPRLPRMEPRIRFTAVGQPAAFDRSAFSSLSTISFA